MVGAGIAGLSAAWELSGGANGPTEATPRVEVIEASGRFGGSLATTSLAGRTIDLGADGFLARRPEATALVHELGLDDYLEAIHESGASLFSRGALHELPAGLVLGVPTDRGALASFRGITWRARLAARRDAVFPRRLSVGEDATIGSIVRAKLGDELSYQIIEPLIGGIQAGRIDELSAKSVFPALFDAARQGGSLAKQLRATSPAPSALADDGVAPTPLFFSLLNGVGSLCEELVLQLRARDVVLRANVAVTALRRTPAGGYPWEVDTLNTTTPANAIVLATPAPVVSALLGAHDSALEELEGVESAGAAMVTFVLANDNVKVPANGTGVLVPLRTPWSGEGTLMVTAITLLDRKWPRLAREGETLLRAHVGRSDDLRWCEMSDDELTERVGAELRFILGRFDAPSETMVQRWPEGLPQYHVGHDVMVRSARQAARVLGVVLAGNAYDGVGVPACIGSGRLAGRDLLESLTG